MFLFFCIRPLFFWMFCTSLNETTTKKKRFGICKERLRRPSEFSWLYHKFIPMKPTTKKFGILYHMVPYRLLQLKWNQISSKCGERLIRKLIKVLSISFCNFRFIFLHFGKHKLVRFLPFHWNSSVIFWSTQILRESRQK